MILEFFKMDVMSGTIIHTAGATFFLAHGMFGIVEWHSGGANQLSGRASVAEAPPLYLPPLYLPRLHTGW